MRNGRARLDDGDLDAEGLHLVAEDLGKAFDGPFADWWAPIPGVPPTRPPIEEHWRKCPECRLRSTGNEEET